MSQRWLHAIFKHDSPPSTSHGKWMLFYLLREVDEKWTSVKNLLFNNKLGPSAKCSTAFSPDEYYKQTRVIIVYTQNYEDANDVFRVAKVLKDELNYPKTMYYKADYQTRAGMYVHKGTKKKYLYSY